MSRLRLSLSAALLALAVALGSLAVAGPAREPAERPELGLMGSIPIYWGEAGDLSELVTGSGQAHWARPRIETRYALRPLDALTGESLAGLRFLLLAQPRALSPAENVALDAWVRGGGRLLLFADPMLTGESRFVIGDRQRPQDVIMLSPILRHWGLELEFDIDRPEEFIVVTDGGRPLPLNRPGRFAAPQDDAMCELAADNALARCEIGAGTALVLADAALLDLYAPHPAAVGALDWLMEQSFKTGEIAGNRRSVPLNTN